MPRITRHGGPSIYGVTPVKGARPDVVSVRVSTADLIGEPDRLGVLAGGPVDVEPGAADSDAATDEDSQEEPAEPEAVEAPKPRRTRAARRTVGG